MALPTKYITPVIPLVDAAEWEQYIVQQPQQPPPDTTAGRVQWWKERLGQFPKLAPVAIAYLSAPRSASQAERSFSLLGHIQTDDRLLRELGLRNFCCCLHNSLHQASCT